MKTVWLIGGFDPSGRAKLLADARMLDHLGVRRLAAVTAVMAQNGRGVRRVEPVAAETLAAQLSSLREEGPPDAVKIVLVPTKALAGVISRALGETNCPVIVDPVEAASSGERLAEVGAYEPLLDRAQVVTPNREESTRGRRNLLKGGHETGPYATDLFQDNQGEFPLTLPRLPGRFRGTGCRPASALAAFAARGEALGDAAAAAKAWLHGDLREGPRWPVPADSFPWSGDRLPRPFPTAGRSPLGLYPIVPRAAFVEYFSFRGVTTIQLRVKDLRGAELEREVAAAVRIARRRQCRLFVNDYWDLALREGAYGVHLGQEDLEGADLRALRDADLRLGVSTHGYRELARAKAVRPTYVALGPIYPTTAKPMRIGPQGLERLTEWVAVAGCPVVAIGGINLENAAGVAASGSDGIAVQKAWRMSPLVSLMRLSTALSSMES